MKKFTVLITILALALSGCGGNTDPVHTTPTTTATANPQTTPDSTAASTPEMSVPSMSPGELNWLVEPELEYNIYYCGICNAFFSEEHLELNETTGRELADREHDAHGGFTRRWVYDPAPLMLGYIELQPGDSVIEMRAIESLQEQFAEQFPALETMLLRVYEIDSTKIESSEYGDYFLPEAYTGRYALFHGMEFVTDFVFEAIEDEYHNDRGNGLSPVAAVMRNGMWGIYNEDGEEVVPPILQEVFIINDGKAFARHNDKFGIIAF